MNNSYKPIHITYPAISIFTIFASERFTCVTREADPTQSTPYDMFPMTYVILELEQLKIYDTPF